QHPEFTAAQLVFQVTGTADNLDHLNPDYVGKMGYGRLNAGRAVTETVTSAPPKIRLLTNSVMDELKGNGNGVVDIGETVQIFVTLENTWATAYNLKAELNIDDWAVTVNKGVADFGTIYGIENIDRMIPFSNAGDPFELTIDSLALPHRIQATLTITADGGYQKEFPFIMAIQPAILYVDDAEIDVTAYYTEVLDALGYSFDYWSHHYQGTPKNLSTYSSVIWNCEWTFPSLNDSDRTALTTFLNHGGSLFLSGQDIGWDLCDPSNDPNSQHEYNRSFGNSKPFFEDYLHAKYIADKSSFSNLMGIKGDPIGDGLNISVYQPGRSAENQYPDELQTLNAGLPIFQYPNDNYGAVRFAGDYRTVYFGFGGFEAITDAATRKTIMHRTLEWLNGLTVTHEPLKDTENTISDYPVTAIIKSVARPLARVEIYWDNDGALPLRYRLAMTAQNDSVYQGFIPAQPDGKMLYTIFAQTTNGYYNAYNFYAFQVGRDLAPPTITNATPIPNTLDKRGPYSCQLRITDNLGVDSAQVWLFYGLKSGLVDSVPMSRFTGEDYLAAIPGLANYGDTIQYYAKARDIAQIPNRIQSEISEFVIGYEDFEDPRLLAWQATPTGWGVDTSFVHTGQYAATESPGRNILPGEELILTLRQPLDFSDQTNWKLTFWNQYHLQRNKSIGYFEVRTDSGAQWESLYQVTSIRRSWGEMVIPLTAYAGQKTVWLRFRTSVAADANDRFDGWYLDDIRIQRAASDAVEEIPLVNAAPDNYVLFQNYPNPFNPATEIRYGLPQTAVVSLEIYNVLGQCIKHLVQAKQPAGVHAVKWDGTNDAGQILSAGIYFYQLKTPEFSQTRKMLWMK
ncbi:T9SS type A sorting domain-containing protein, partial [candidate division KSB1 bacterium]|nr:T9SS type A sorting domain-containing protein [candidate division KSB1 bacterium]